MKINIFCSSYSWIAKSNDKIIAVAATEEELIDLLKEVENA